MSSEGVDVVTSADDEGRGLLPKLRFPEFRDAGEWAPASIGQFLTESRIVGGKGDSARKLTVKLWGGGVFAKNEARRGSENTQYYKRSAGQFIYSKLDFLNQAFGVIPAQLDGLESTVDLPCFDIGAGLSPKFLLEYVQRDQFFRRNGELADGGRKAKRIQVEDFLSFSIDLPPLPAEQKKIADCLSSLDDLIAAEGDRLAALREYKKGLTQQLFPHPERIENGKKILAETAPRLRFPEFKDAGQWERAPLGPRTSKIGSGITPKGGQAAYKNVGRPFMRSQNVGWGELRLEDIAFIDERTHSGFAATEIQADDVLLNITGASIGRSAIADHRIVGGNVSQHVCIIRVDRRALTPGYLNQFLLGQEGQSQIDSFQAGGNRQGLNFDQIRSFKIPSPPELDEQERVADCLSSIDSLLFSADRRISELKAHKSGLMQRLFPSPAEAYE